MKIALFTLGQKDQHDPDWIWHKVDESNRGRFAYNLKYLWAWNLTGNHGFESDGPCVFISFEEE